MDRRLIVNADDFGLTSGVNAGIIEAHERGIVTSATLMVDAPAAGDAAALAAARPRLGLGLHVDLTGLDEPSLADPTIVLAEIRRQLTSFAELTGGGPTHLDSHHHLHLERLDLFRRATSLPLRGDGTAALVRAFYGLPDLERVSPTSLVALIGSALAPGWTELMCHPGHVTPELVSSYRTPREHELAALIHPRVRDALRAASVRLSTFADVTSAG